MNELLKLLERYNPSVQNAQKTGRWTKYALESKDSLISDEDLERMKEAGLAFDPIDINHDNSLQNCFRYYKSLSKKHITDCFLSGLSSGEHRLRAGLSAYAIMQTLPDHKYIDTPAKNCEICCSQEKEGELDLTFMNSCRYFEGGLIGKSPYSVMFYLEQHTKLEPHKPQQADFDIFNEILRICIEADDAMVPNILFKKIRKINGLKLSVWQARNLLQTLGYCSILESEKHKGYLTNYTNLALPPRKTHSSDWAYPIDFWRGKDGVNKQALDFWFGDYPEIIGS